MIKINVLNNYKDLVNISLYDIEREYNQKLKQIEIEKEEYITNIILKSFNNIKFKKKILDKYKEDIVTLCSDIITINVINQLSYMRSTKIIYAYRNFEGSSYYLHYNITNNRFRKVFDKISYIKEYYDIDIPDYERCVIGIYFNSGYFILSNEDFEETDDCNGVAKYYIPKTYYPIILKLEELLNENSEELIRLINRHYRQIMEEIL